MSSAGNRLQNRRFHFEKALVFENPAQRPKNLRSDAESLTYFGIEQEVDLAPPKALLHVSQALPMGGNRTQRFRQNSKTSRLKCGFSATRPNEFSPNREEIPEVKRGNPRKRLPEGLTREKHLEFSARIRAVEKRGASMDAKTGDAARNRDLARARECGEVLLNLCGGESFRSMLPIQVHAEFTECSGLPKPYSTNGLNIGHADLFYPSARLRASITVLAHNTLRAAHLAKLVVSHVEPPLNATRGEYCRTWHTTRCEPLILQNSR